MQLSVFVNFVHLHTDFQENVQRYSKFKMLHGKTRYAVLWSRAD